MADIAPIAALAGGVLTLFAPCSALLLPTFFSYAASSTRALFVRTIVFGCGLLLTLIPLGVVAGSAGAFLRTHTDTMTTVAAGIIILLGLLLVFSISIPRPRLRKVRVTPRKITAQTAGNVGGIQSSNQNDSLATPLSLLTLGAVYGIAGVGCAGPILGALLLTAGIGGNPWYAALLMVLYAAGMTVPLFSLALVWSSLPASWKAWTRPRTIRIFGRDTTIASVISGVIFIALGISLLIFGANNPLGSIISGETLASWETSIVSTVSRIPTWAIVLPAICLAVAGILWIRERQK